MNTHHITNQRGFSLIEIMVALLITGIMMTLIMQFIFSQMNAYQREQRVSDTQQNLRSAMDQISRDIRMAGAGIPKVPIYTGVSVPLPGTVTAWPNWPIYPLMILRGAPPPMNSGVPGYSMFWNLNNTIMANENDSIIIIYKDPDRPLADTALTADFIVQTDKVMVPATAVNATTGFTANTPFMIIDAAGTKADLFLATSIVTNASSAELVRGVTWNINNNSAAYNFDGWGHQVNLPASATATSGYHTGDRVIPIKIIRYDFSTDLVNFPITRLVNNDGIRGSDNEIGSFFGSTVVPVSPANTISAQNYTNRGLKIEYLPYTGAIASTAFSRGMPADPYMIGTVRITLTARTAAPTASSSLFRTRTLSTDIQPRNYNGN